MMQTPGGTVDDVTSPGVVGSAMIAPSTRPVELADSFVPAMAFPSL